ncbi:MAG: RNA repair transcriptional activator RtcR [Pseudomonadota bacterium]
MDNVIIGFLGTQLDMGKRRKWRPSVQLCAHNALPVARLELLYDQHFADLAGHVQRSIAHLSPTTEVRLCRLDLTDPWDFEEVYAKLFDFAQDYGFDEERERYHVHLTTGTHVAQICWFLLTEARHIPARLIQTGPPRGEDTPNGTLDVIDLDLSRYNALQQRFDLLAEQSADLLKGGIETRNPAFNALIERIERVATASDAPLLLLGATGTGKTALAERIYTLKRKARRLRGRFVHVNCGTLRREAGMATLFGNRRGAAGGAPERRGLMREADGGLLFLDEIDALGPDEQTMVLHAVESGKFLPLGSDHEIASRFQLIAGANRDLARLVAEGAFRADLYARLNLWTFRLPRLRERREDIEPNLEHELAKAEALMGARVGFNADAAQRYLGFARHPGTLWPGNFRDLGASVQRMCTLAPRGRITLAMVEQEIEILQAQWAGTADDSDTKLVRGYLGPAVEEIDPFDLAQLAAVMRVCETSASLSEAGRTLFAVSRTRKRSTNDADRLRKFLERFGLRWSDFEARSGVASVR